jgi:ER membrane protein complex subunit 7
MRLLLPVFGLLVAAAAAADLVLYLPVKPNPYTLPASTHATLTSLGARHEAPVSSLNAFVFRNVSAPASYLVDVHCATDAFRPLRIDIAADGTLQAWETFRGNEWDNKGEALPIRDGREGKGVEVRAQGPKNYFSERPKCAYMSAV